jgi:hypothetical protein
MTGSCPAFFKMRATTSNGLKCPVAGIDARRTFIDFLSRFLKSASRSETSAAATSEESSCWLALASTPELVPTPVQNKLQVSVIVSSVSSRDVGIVCIRHTRITSKSSSRLNFVSLVWLSCLCVHRAHKRRFISSRSDAQEHAMLSPGSRASVALKPFATHHLVLCGETA